ncbi:MAG: hypothetical protein ABEJ31_12245 [Haloarculaceae archaeon]
MAEQLQRRTLDELLNSGRYLYPTHVVGVIERFHAVEGPGVPRETVLAYANAVLDRLGRRAPYGPERFAALLDARLVDAEVWLPNALYAVGPGRLSVFPSRWHRRLAGVRDPVQYVGVIGEDLAIARGADVNGPLPPVPRRLLVEAMMALGGVDRPTAGGLLREARRTGRVRIEPDQNPEADVWLADPSLWPRGATAPKPTDADPTTPGRPPV